MNSRPFSLTVTRKTRLGQPMHKSSVGSFASQLPRWQRWLTHVNEANDPGRNAAPAPSPPVLSLKTSEREITIHNETGSPLKD